MRYTIKQLAKLSGVSTRTLRFYDEIGLLKPAFYGDNQYRYYKEELCEVPFYVKYVEFFPITRMFYLIIAIHNYKPSKNFINPSGRFCFFIF